MKSKAVIQSVVAACLLIAAGAVWWNKTAPTRIPSELVFRNAASEGLAVQFTTPEGEIAKIEIASGSTGKVKFVPGGRLDVFVKLVQPPLGSWYIDAAFSEVTASLNGNVVSLEADGLTTRPAE